MVNSGRSRSLVSLVRVGFFAAVALLWAGGVSAQTVWSLRSPVTQSNNLHALTWTGAGGILVATGASGTIVTSPDGINWTIRGAGATNRSLYGVAASGASSNSRIVAVGLNGTVLWSTPGTIGTWNTGTSGTDNHLNAVTWTGSQFVAVGANGTIISSGDGELWTTRSSSMGKTLNGVTSSGSTLIAVGVDGNIERSTDGGVNWVNRPSGVTTIFYAVAGTGTTFYTVGASGGMRASTDGGLTWGSRTSGAGSSYLAGLTLLGSQFVAVGNAGMIVGSTDGTIWTPRTPAITSNPLGAVVWMGSQFVAVGNGGVVLTSPDGNTWSQTSSHAVTINAVSSDGNQMVAVGNAGNILTSPNGIDWTRRTSGVTGTLNGSTWTGTRWAAVGAAGGAVLTSSDGITWNPQLIGGSTTVTHYTVTGNVDTLVAGGGGSLAVSTNGGANWTAISSPTGAAYYGSAWYGNQRYIAVGISGDPAIAMIRTSTNNGVSWQNRNLAGLTNTLFSVAYAANLPTPLLVVVGSQGKILTAPASNPASWTSQTSPVSSALLSVTWTGSQFVAVGPSGVVVTSPDGITWIKHTAVTTAALNTTTWAGAPLNQVVAAGVGGTVITSSPDAVPAVPTATAPAASATGVPVNPIFTWLASSGATSYGLQVSTSSDFTSPLIDQTTTGPSFQVGPLTPDVTYHWRVRASGTTGNSAWSTPRTFTVVAAASSAPTLLTPADAATNLPIPTTVTWEAYAGATAYRVQLSTSSTFGTLLFNDSLPGTQLQRLYSTLNNSTTYHWRVYARLASGVTAWSAVRSFTTTAPAPAVPVLATPADEAIAVSFPTTTVTWNASSGASAYRLQVSTSSSFATTMRDTVVTGATSALVSNLVVNGVYYWRVSAENAAGSSAFSTGRMFTTATSAPAAPVLASPAAGALDVDVFTSLTWNASAGTSTYHVQLSTASNFSTIVVQDSTLTVLTFTPGQLANSTTYYWRVRARNPAGVSAWSERSFMSGMAPTAPPPAPVPISPAQFATGVALAPTLTWNAAATARSYHVQISTTTSFATLVINDSLIAGTSRAIANLAGSTSYYWRVAGTNSIGTGAWSEVFNFTTLNTVPAVPEQVAPEAFATGVSISPTLSWNVSAGASAYIVQVSTATSFATFVVNDSITATSRAIGPLGGNTDYYWRVRARNAAGSSGYSATRRFTTGAVPLPAVPIQVAPAQFDTGIAVAGVTLVWDAASGASSYRVQVSVSPTFATIARDDSGFTAISRFVGPLLAATDYYWRVSSKNSAGVSAFSSTRRFTTTQGTSLLPGGIVMRSMSFGAGRSLRFGLPAAQRVTVRIFDMRGNLVVDLLDEPRSAGYHTLALPPSLRGGLYLVDFRAGSTRLTLKTQP